MKQRGVQEEVEEPEHEQETQAQAEAGLRLKPRCCQFLEHAEWKAWVSGVESFIFQFSDRLDCVGRSAIAFQ